MEDEFEFNELEGLIPDNENLKNSGNLNFDKFIKSLRS